MLYNLFLPPALSFPPVFPPFPFLRSNSPLKFSYRESGGALYAPPVGFGAEPQHKSNFVHFSFKTWHAMATMLMILPNFVQAYWYDTSREGSDCMIFTRPEKCRTWHTVA